MTEEVTTQTTETTTGATDSTATDSTPSSAVAPVAETATASGAAGGAGNPDGMPTPPPYTPNFKFKYFDAKSEKQIEKEMDEYLRGVVKDEKTEKQLRDLYERAYGLDAAKHSREKVRAEADTLRTEIKETKRALGVLSKYVQDGDMQSFFESLKIPEDVVLKYAMDRVQYREWTPQQRAEYDNLRSTKARAEYLAEQNQVLEQNYLSAQAQSREAELSRTLTDQNVRTVAEAFDARVGRPGAFREEVIRRGQYYWHQYQKDIPVEQAVNEVLQIAGGMTPPATPVIDAPKSAPSPVAEKKPVIPNIQGKGSSPAKKLPKSIEDLKKLSAAMA